MSKRAEELARAVAKSVSDAIHTPIVLDIYGSAVDMIDAELRKERERCAENAVKCIEMALYGTSAAWPCTVNELRAAILSEEE